MTQCTFHKLPAVAQTPGGLPVCGICAKKFNVKLADEEVAACPHCGLTAPPGYDMCPHCGNLMNDPNPNDTVAS